MVGAVVLEALLVLLNRFYFHADLETEVNIYLGLHEVLRVMRMASPVAVMLYWLVIAWAVLALVFYIYQRDFFLGASACGMSVLALWFVRYGAAGRPETLLVLAAIVVVGLGALWLKKNDGVLSEKMNLQFLPKKTSYAVLLVTCLASLAAVVVAMVAGDMVAYYLMFVMVAWLFALFVYSTVKMR